jgi:hypothetical protein
VVVGNQCNAFLLELLNSAVHVLHHCCCCRHLNRCSELVGAGYAYIMTHPGIPCVFWDHYVTWGAELHNTIKTLAAVSIVRDVWCFGCCQWRYLKQASCIVLRLHNTTKTLAAVSIALHVSVVTVAVRTAG